MLALSFFVLPFTLAPARDGADGTVPDDTVKKRGNKSIAQYDYPTCMHACMVSPLDEKEKERTLADRGDQFLSLVWTSKSTSPWPLMN